MEEDWLVVWDSKPQVQVRALGSETEQNLMEMSKWRERAGFRFQSDLVPGTRLWWNIKRAILLQYPWLWKYYISPGYIRIGQRKNLISEPPTKPAIFDLIWSRARGFSLLILGLLFQAWIFKFWARSFFILSTGPGFSFWAWGFSTPNTLGTKNLKMGVNNTLVYFYMILIFFKYGQFAQNSNLILGFTWNSALGPGKVHMLPGPS